MNIIELAKQAGASYSSNPDEYDVLNITDDSLQAFAKLVAAHEREACAKICDDGYFAFIAADIIRERRTLMTGYESKRAAARDKFKGEEHMTKEEIIKALRDMAKYPTVTLPRDSEALKAAADLLAQSAQEPMAKYCCHVCFDKSGQTFLDRMILCSECGNKRCPKATNHALPCTNSNNPLQPAQEPVAWRYRGNLHEFDPSDWATGPVTPLYTAPPQRPWVGLTDEEIMEIAFNFDVPSLVIRTVEFKLKEKNT